MESPTTKGFLLGIGVMVLLIIAFLAGGYFYSGKESIRETKNIVKVDQEDKIQNPQQQTTTTPPAPQDSRQLISSQTKYTQEYIIKNFLPETWNEDAPTTTSVYSNAQKGVEIALPWNPLWGTKNYKIAPYENNKNGIDFGFMGLCGEGAGCLDRIYEMSFSPAKSLSEEIKARTDGTSKVTSFKVGNFSVVQTDQEPGLCSMTYLTVIGKKFNYTFGGACGLDDKQMAEIKAAIATMKFL